MDLLKCTLDSTAEAVIERLVKSPWFSGAQNISIYLSTGTSGEPSCPSALHCESSHATSSSEIQTDQLIRRAFQDGLSRLFPSEVEHASLTRTHFHRKVALRSLLPRGRTNSDEDAASLVN